jgi:hypothetical protein
VPACAWALVAAFLFSRAADRQGPAAASRLLRIGAAGWLALIALASPPIVARHESGRDLFTAARGREVLAWGAWRTAWMAGYFYNDGRVREVANVTEITRAAQAGKALVVCGPAECRRLTSAPSLLVEVVAHGPRRNALVEVARR